MDYATSLETPQLLTCRKQSTFRLICLRRASAVKGCRLRLFSGNLKLTPVLLLIFRQNLLGFEIISLRFVTPSSARVAWAMFHIFNLPFSWHARIIYSHR